MSASGQPPVPLLRMIGRLNVGGPAIQAITLTRRLEEHGYRTTLVRGIEGPREGNMDALAEAIGVRPVRVGSLRRELGRHDLLALARTIAIMLRVRPVLLHTHAAKAGTVGRAASLLLGPLGPPIRVHTFHGHVLTGYFGARSSRVFLAVERFLARHTTRLIAVSEEVRDDLLALGVAPPERIVVVPLGLDLERFSHIGPEDRGPARAAFGLPPDAPVVTLVARLVPIKRVDRFLRIAGAVAALAPEVRFLIVGDGELRDALHSSTESRALADRVVWAGMRSDMTRVYAASDVVVQTSDNEGTPVALIEAQAAACATVSTDVGGVRSVVIDEHTGLVVDAGDEPGFAAAVTRLVGDGQSRARLGAAGRAHVLGRFGLDRLVADIAGLYRELGAVR